MGVLPIYETRRRRPDYLLVSPYSAYTKHPEPPLNMSQLSKSGEHPSKGQTIDKERSRPARCRAGGIGSSQAGPLVKNRKRLNCARVVIHTYLHVSS